MTLNLWKRFNENSISLPTAEMPELLDLPDDLLVFIVDGLQYTSFGFKVGLGWPMWSETQETLMKQQVTQNALFLPLFSTCQRIRNVMTSILYRHVSFSFRKYRQQGRALLLPEQTSSLVTIVSGIATPTTMTLFHLPAI